MTDTVAHTAVRPALAFIPDLIARLLPASVISLIIRVAIAAVFFLSGRIKVEGLLDITVECGTNAFNAFLVYQNLTDGTVGQSYVTEGQKVRVAAR